MPSFMALPMELQIDIITLAFPVKDTEINNTTGSVLLTYGFVRDVHSLATTCASAAIILLDVLQQHLDARIAERLNIATPVVEGRMSSGQWQRKRLMERRRDVQERQKMYEKRIRSLESLMREIRKMWKLEEFS